MLEMTQLLTVFRKLFADRSYGETLHHYISSRNPQSPADVELLEKQWQYNNIKNTGGHWL
jgi:hypothetical protein